MVGWSVIVCVLLDWLYMYAGQRRRRRSEELLAVVLVELWLIVALSALLS